MPDEKFNPLIQCCDHVPERNVGAFVGWPYVNDYGRGIMHCCTGNAVRALYYIWEHILTYKQGQLHVNLLLNRASPWADVDSHIPYVGRVDVKIKQPVELSIRIPEWVAPDQASCSVNGQSRPLSFQGRYAQVGAVKPSETVTLTFPIAERTDEVLIIQRQKCTLIRKGNEIVHMVPLGTTYQRAHYRENQTRWKKVTRFVLGETIAW